jgi:hypothetical protein
MAMTAAVAAGAGYLAAKRKPKEGAERDEAYARDKDKADAKKDDKKSDEKPAKKKDDKPSKKGAPKKDTELDGLPLALGDVVTSAGEERWLAGALILRDAGKIASIVFIAPEGAEHHAVVAFPKPRTDIYWLRPTQIESPEEPPATIEIGTTALRRKARLPVTIERKGQGAPELGEAGVIAMYDGGGRDVAIVVTSEGKAHGWVGTRLDSTSYDRLGGGGED